MKIGEPELIAAEEHVLQPGFLAQFTARRDKRSEVMFARIQLASA